MLFSGLFGATTSAAPTAGGLFGTQNANTAQSTGSLFSKPAATPGFSLTAPAASSAASTGVATGGLFSTPATSKPPSLFGQPLANAAAASTISGTGMGLQLGQQKPTGTATPVLSSILGGTASSASTASTVPSFGVSTSAPSSQPSVGSLFGTSVSSSATTLGGLGKSLVVSQPAAGTPNFSFGIPKASTTAVSSTGGGLSLNISGAAASSTTGAVSSTGTSLFTGAAAATSAAPGLGLSLGVKTSTSTAAPSVSIQPTVTTVSLGGSTTVAQQATGKEVTFKQLEENVSKWNDDLDELERQFLAQATQINAWDRLVLENGDRITALNEEIGKIKSNQDKLDHDLDFIGTQQKDLEEFINNLEGSLANSAISQPQDAADEQRRDIFATAENVDCQLKQMTQDLREVIERINASTQSDESSVVSPFGQLERILNAHVDSLNWADQNIENLAKQIDQIQIPKVAN